MEIKANIAALFDMDGVVVDTESQYSVFWDKVGTEYLGIPRFDARIKGTTTAQIGEKYFRGKEEEFVEVVRRNSEWESQMTYNYFPGVISFIEDLRTHGVKLALVTSSDANKMRYVYRAHPEMTTLFDEILVAEHFTRSKPDPQCFLLAMERLGATPENSFVFEDSFHGLKAGMDSGATVFGLATTNPREAIEGKAHVIIDGFQAMNYRRMMQAAR